MCYRCDVCNGVTEKNTPQLRYPIYRMVGGLKQIERELRVCKDCHTMLVSGIPLNKVARGWVRERPVQAPPPISSVPHPKKGTNGRHKSHPARVNRVKDFLSL